MSKKGFISVGISGIEEFDGCLQPEIMTEPLLSLHIKVKAGGGKHHGVSLHHQGTYFVFA